MEYRCRQLVKLVFNMSTILNRILLTFWESRIIGLPVYEYVRVSKMRNVTRAKMPNLGAAIWRILNIKLLCFPRCIITVITFTKIYWSLPMHSNVTIKNVSWPHFSWPTLYLSVYEHKYFAFFFKRHSVFESIDNQSQWFYWKKLIFHN